MLIAVTFEERFQTAIAQSGLKITSLYSNTRYRDYYTAVYGVTSALRLILTVFNRVGCSVT